MLDAINTMYLKESKNFPERIMAFVEGNLIYVPLNGAEPFNFPTHLKAVGMLCEHIGLQVPLFSVGRTPKGYAFTQCSGEKIENPCYLDNLIYLTKP